MSRCMHLTSLRSLLFRLRCIKSLHDTPCFSRSAAGRALHQRLICSSSASDSICKAQAEAANRPHRFYIEHELPLSAGELVDLTPEESKHATKALRLCEGDQLELCDGSGNIMLAEIAGGGRKVVTVSTLSAPRQEAWAGPKWEVAAGFSMLKGGRADWLIEKCTELGAHSVWPLVSERVHGAGAGWKLDAKPSKNKEDSPHGRQARWERVAVAATKQSLRAHGLLLHPQTPLVGFLPRMSEARLALVAVTGAPEVLADSAARSGLAQLRDGDGAMLIVGPEGDFTPAEVDSLIAAGAHPVGLGPLRLRVETAAIGLLAAVTAYHRSSQSPAA